MGSPSILQQSGWKFSSLKKGDKTTLIINPLKNGKAGGFSQYGDFAGWTRAWKRARAESTVALDQTS